MPAIDVCIPIAGGQGASMGSSSAAGADRTPHPDAISLAAVDYTTSTNKIAIDSPATYDRKHAFFFNSRVAVLGDFTSTTAVRSSNAPVLIIACWGEFTKE